MELMSDYALEFNSCVFALRFVYVVWFLAHSKNELMQWRGVRRLSVRPSVRL